MDAWQDYKRRNDSVVVDLMHGQLKSTLTCNICNKVSVKFDPFSLLALPVPANENEVNSAMNTDKIHPEQKETDEQNVQTESASVGEESSPSDTEAQQPRRSTSQQSTISTIYSRSNEYLWVRIFY